MSPLRSLRAVRERSSPPTPLRSFDQPSGHMNFGDTDSGRRQDSRRDGSWLESLTASRSRARHPAIGARGGVPGRARRRRQERCGDFSVGSGAFDLDEHSIVTTVLQGHHPATNIAELEFIHTLRIPIVVMLDHVRRSVLEELLAGGRGRLNAEEWTLSALHEALTGNRLAVRPAFRQDRYRVRRARR